METMTPTMTVGYIDNSFYISQWTRTGKLVQVFGTSRIKKESLIKALKAKCIENSGGFIGWNSIVMHENQFHFFAEILDEPKQRVGFDL